MSKPPPSKYNPQHPPKSNSLSPQAYANRLHRHLHSPTLTLSKRNPRSTFLANRWIGLLESTLDALPLGPTPLQLLLSTKQQDITTCFEKMTERARLTEHTTFTTRQHIHVTIKGRTKHNRPSTRLAADPIPIENHRHSISPTLTHHTPIDSIIQACPPKHPRHSKKPSRATEYMV